MDVTRIPAALLAAARGTGASRIAPESLMPRVGDDLRHRVRYQGTEWSDDFSFDFFG